MFLKQYYLGCLAHASYLIADEATKVAVVVDPQRDVERYLADAESMGLRIEHVFLTHFHADFLAGHLELRRRTGARIHLGARAEAEFEFHAMADGDELEWGSLRLKVLETPGHTPEGISILVYDLAGDAESPHAVLTGDTLFIGDVGRPDLMASVGITAEELAGMLYDSLHGKLLKLPDETLVYPAHGAGSMCGKNLSTDTVSTIGAQRATNYALQPMSREEFVAMSVEGLPEAPAYFSYDAMLNRREHGTLEDRLADLKAVPLESVLALRDDKGAQLLDVRDPAEFAASHLEGAINIPLDGRFATWAGTLLGQTAPIIVIAARGSEAEAVTRLGRIGFDHVAGYLDDRELATGERSDLLRRVERVEPASLAAQLASDTPPVLLDVRTRGEWEERHVDGSVNIPLGELPRRLAEVPRDRHVVTMCRTGYRSSIAASILQARGFDDIADEIGGIMAWEDADSTCSATAGDATSDGSPS